MLIKLSREGQSIFDIVLENFGTLDNLIDVTSENDISLSGQLLTNTELTINNAGLGNNAIKTAIAAGGLTFNNSYEPLALVPWSRTDITFDSETITFDQQ